MYCGLYFCYYYYYISSILGHSSEEMTHIYLDSIDGHILAEANRRVMDAFGKYMKVK